MPLKTIEMKSIYETILKAKAESRKLLAILLDPDKTDIASIKSLILKINTSPATHVFVGGSSSKNHNIDALIKVLKRNCELPVVLFPGNPSQISTFADAILFLFLLSGRNPDYLIGHQVKAVPILKKTDLEIISTGYILIESGNETAVSKVSQTLPLDRNNHKHIVNTAQAGEMLGNKLIYLEAGSGAKLSVPRQIIKAVAQNIKIPLIVGGGIINYDGIFQAFEAGADMVVIGTAFENNSDFFMDFKMSRHVISKTQ